MIAETLAGIALFKSAVDGIKSAINTANDISEIGGFIDQLFEGEKQVQEQRNKKAGVSSFDTGNVAREIIDARLAQEQMREIATMVDLRFGPGTWKSILEERNKRIREAKEAETRAALERQQQTEEWIEMAQVGLAVVFIVVLAIAVISFTVS